MLKLQGVRSYFVTNIKKIIIILAKFIYFSQKMLHFVNSFPACWQRVSHQLFTQVATSLSSPSTTQSSMATEWVTAQLATRPRVDQELEATSGTQGATSPCHAQPAAEQPGLLVVEPLIAGNCIVPQPYCWAQPPHCYTQHICSFLLLVTTAPESLPEKPQGAQQNTCIFSCPASSLGENL